MNRDNRKPSYSQSRPPAAKPFYSGEKVFINVSHPLAKNTLYLCQGMVIRVPRNRSEDKYKIIVTGVRSFSEKDSQSFLNRLIGMKVVRHSKAISREEPWANNNLTWVKVDSQKAVKMFRLAVSAIKKEPYRQSKNRPVPRLD